MTSRSVDVALHVPPGEAFCIPRGAVHGFDYHGAGDAKSLATCRPGIMRPAYSREIHDMLAANPGSAGPG